MFFLRILIVLSHLCLFELDQYLKSSIFLGSSPTAMILKVYILQFVLFSRCLGTFIKLVVYSVDQPCSAPNMVMEMFLKRVVL